MPGSSLCPSRRAVVGQNFCELGRENPKITMAFSALAWVGCGHFAICSVSLFQTLVSLMTSLKSLCISYASSSSEPSQILFSSACLCSAAMHSGDKHSKAGRAFDAQKVHVATLAKPLATALHHPAAYQVFLLKLLFFAYILIGCRHIGNPDNGAV